MQQVLEIGSHRHALRRGVHERCRYIRGNGFSAHLICGIRARVRITSVTITVYQKPTCTTCRQVYAALRDAGVDFEAVDYYTDPIPKTKLRELLRKMGIPASALLRTKEEIYKELRLGEKDLTDDQILDLMVKHPDLIQRPIVEKGSRAILARPAERLKEIL
jgi:arsenate reductase